MSSDIAKVATHYGHSGLVPLKIFAHLQGVRLVMMAERFWLPFS
ncbi:hypothetical protein [Marinomonas sp. TW1]|nr:hypothetical protein [Marinomonas sp. TW1]